jgi:hypothetical protein
MDGPFEAYVDRPFEAYVTAIITLINVTHVPVFKMQRSYSFKFWMDEGYSIYVQSCTHKTYL